MADYKHAELLRAIADNKQIQCNGYVLGEEPITDAQVWRDISPEQALFYISRNTTNLLRIKPEPVVVCFWHNFNGSCGSIPKSKIGTPKIQPETGYVVKHTYIDGKIESVEILETFE